MARWVAFFLLVAGVAFMTPLCRFLVGPSILLLAAGSVQLFRRSPPEAASSA
jgi:hypothetical protein